jgi:SAM-dependent methyltransferase
MGQAIWGADPEFFGPRHAHREGRIVRCLGRVEPVAGLHLECAAGVGSLSVTLARLGRTVIAADRSLRSLAVVTERSVAAGLSSSVLPVVVDITSLPFADGTFAGASSAETLEHIADHESAVSELARVLAPGARLVGTVPAGPDQWSEWDDWAGHQRRYTAAEMAAVLAGAGLEPTVTCWGWPLLRLYDAVVLTRINRRRLQHDGSVDSDPALTRVAGLGRRRWLVSLVRTLFEFDRLFDGAPWGVGLLFAARKRPRES